MKLEVEISMKNWNYVDDYATESPKQPNGGCYALNTEQSMIWTINGKPSENKHSPADIQECGNECIRVFHNSCLIRWIQQNEIYINWLCPGFNPDLLLSFSTIQPLHCNLNCTSVRL